MSEDLPDPNNRVSIDSDGKIRLAYTANNLKSHGELVKHWTKLMRSMGYPIIITQKMDIKVAMHQCGTARFGKDPKTSVLDPICRSGTWTISMSSTPRSCRRPPPSTRHSPSLRRRCARQNTSSATC